MIGLFVLLIRATIWAIVVTVKATVMFAVLILALFAMMRKATR